MTTRGESQVLVEHDDGLVVLAVLLPLLLSFLSFCALLILLFSFSFFLSLSIVKALRTIDSRCSWLSFFGVCSSLLLLLVSARLNEGGDLLLLLCGNEVNSGSFLLPNLLAFNMVKADSSGMEESTDEDVVTEDEDDGEWLGVDVVVRRLLLAGIAVVVSIAESKGVVMPFCSFVFFLVLVFPGCFCLVFALFAASPAFAVPPDEPGATLFSEDLDGFFCPR